jgi:uncharacterized protein with HEPN domain
MPSDRDQTKRWLIDIRHHIAMAERFIDGLDYGSFKDDTFRLYAVTRCLEIITAPAGSKAGRSGSTSPASN